MTTTTIGTEGIELISARRRTWYSGARRGSERPDGKSIAFFDFSGLDDNVLDQIYNRRNRPYTQARPLVEKALRDAGITFTKTRWSQHAGCTCPCSPGFVLEGAARGWDYWVAVGPADPNDIEEGVR